MSLEKVPFQGRSMHPTFRNVKFVWVRFDVKIGEVGDVLLYRDVHGELVCHRLIEKTEDVYWLKGDGSAQSEHVQASQILGRVEGVEIAGSRVNLKSDVWVRGACYLQRWHSACSNLIFKKSLRRVLFFYFWTLHVLRR